jgi:hypothetical protein
MLLLAPVAGVLTIVLGALSFLPFHVLKTVGVSDGANLALLVLVCVGTLAMARKTGAGSGDARFLVVPVAYHAFFLLVALARGSVAEGGAKGALIVAATVCSLSLQAYAWRRGLGATWGVSREVERPVA